MKKLHTLARMSADYFARERGATVGVWLPDARADTTGVLRVHTTADRYADEDPLGWVRSADRFRRLTGLGPVLGYLGISTEVKSGDAQLEFAPLEEMARRGAALNETLPPQHKLPKLTVVPGSVIPAKEFLEYIAKDTVPLADGRDNSSRKRGQSALIAAHDVAFHLPSWLSLDPDSRKRLAEQAERVLSGPEDPDEYTGNTNADRLTGAIDRYIAPPNLGAGRFVPTTGELIDQTGSSSVLLEIGLSGPGGVSMTSEEKANFTQLSIGHVMFLGEHVQGLDPVQ